MTIETLQQGTARVPSAKVICDQCGRDEVIPCSYMRPAKNNRFPREPNQGQIIKKMTGRNWEFLKGKSYCPACSAKRRAHTSKPSQSENNGMTTATATDLRAPSRDQRREIFSLLTEVHDTDAGCYIGPETDKTVADALGDGVLPGWVAQIREDNFGPSGGNSDMTDLSADLRDFIAKGVDLMTDVHAKSQELREMQRALADAVEKARAHDQKIQAIIKAVGPKARV